MSDQAVILPKWSSHETVILAKEQLDHSYTFWNILIFILVVANLMQQSLSWHNIGKIIHYDVPTADWLKPIFTKNLTFDMLNIN